jgi:hypothetical protein
VLTDESGKPLIGQPLYYGIMDTQAGRAGKEE